MLPRVCLGCGEAIDIRGPALCDTCSNELMLLVGGAYCHTCGSEQSPHVMIDGQCGPCRLNGPVRVRFDGFVRVGRYAGVLRSLILRFKRDWGVEKILGRMLGDAIGGRFDPQEIDYWAPVPSHWRRRIQRGYQPSALLSRRALRPWGVRVKPLLKMTRYVPPFHSQQMTFRERYQAIKGAFQIVSNRDIHGRTICLVDDVTTTGATLSEAQRTLRHAGAKRVFAAVLAKTTGSASVR